jgi:hypothetical protein
MHHLARIDADGADEVPAAEVLDDSLEMPRDLAQEGYHHAAAFVAGAVLPDSPRRELRERDLKATGSLESMNRVALDGGIYPPVAYSQVKIWIEIRNHADHGEWDAVEAAQAKGMIEGIPPFLARWFELPTKGQT